MMQSLHQTLIIAKPGNLVLIFRGKFGHHGHICKQKLNKYIHICVNSADSSRHGSMVTNTRGPPVVYQCEHWNGQEQTTEVTQGKETCLVVGRCKWWVAWLGKGTTGWAKKEADREVTGPNRGGSRQAAESTDQWEEVEQELHRGGGGGVMQCGHLAVSLDQVPELTIYQYLHSSFLPNP